MRPMTDFASEVSTALTEGANRMHRPTTPNAMARALTQLQRSCFRMMPNPRSAIGVSDISRTAAVPEVTYFMPQRSGP